MHNERHDERLSDEELELFVQYLHRFANHELDIGLSLKRVSQVRILPGERKGPAQRRFSSGPALRHVRGRVTPALVNLSKRHVLASNLTEPLVDDGEDQLSGRRREVLPSSHRLQGLIGEGQPNAGFQVVREIARKVPDDTKLGSEAVPRMSPQPGARVSGSDPELHVARALYDVEHVPGLTRTMATDPLPLLDSAGNGFGSMAFAADQLMCSSVTQPRRLHDETAELLHPSLEPLPTCDRINAHAPKASA
ncbi:hypothetical protein ACWEPR_02325 [Streptomyces sp. NPDC004290]